MTVASGSSGSFGSSASEANGRGAVVDAAPVPEEAVPGSASLSREILLSQRLRAWILTVMILSGLGLFLAAALLPGAGGPELHRRFRSAIPPVVLLSLAAVGYEVAAYAVAGRWLRAGRRPPTPLLYLGSAIEVTFPTMAILASSRALGPASSLASALAIFYPTFVLLSVLRLDPLLSAFTGTLAGAEYAVAALLLVGRTAGGGPPSGSQGLPGGLPVFNLLASRWHHMIVAGLYALTGFVAAFVARRLRRQAEEAVRQVEDRNRIVSLFGQHVSPAVVDKLLALERRAIEVVGEVRHVCVLFLDIRDFTAFSESRSPVEVVRYLNSLFEFMIDIVNEHQGIVNKFLGDGFMAVFGAPVDDGDDCRHAASAALAIVERVNALCARGELPPTRIGIGLHSGEAVTGNVGSSRRKEYTIVGNVVNLASRIEQLNKTFGSQVLASESVWTKCAVCGGAPLLALPDGRAEDLGHVTVKGQQAPVRLYRLA